MMNASSERLKGAVQLGEKFIAVEMDPHSIGTILLEENYMV